MAKKHQRSQYCICNLLVAKQIEALLENQKRENEETRSNEAIGKFLQPYIL